MGGWTRGIGPAAELAALHVGVYEDGHLRYAGKVGSGFTRASRAELLAALRPLVTDEPPFSPSPPKRLAAGTHLGAAGGRHPRRVRRLGR